jgi:hypothetical protein
MFEEVFVHIPNNLRDGIEKHEHAHHSQHPNDAPRTLIGIPFIYFLSKSPRPKNTQPNSQTQKETAVG